MNPSISDNVHHEQPMDKQNQNIQHNDMSSTTNTEHDQPSPRIAHLKAQTLGESRYMSIEQARLITESYQLMKMNPASSSVLRP